MMAVAGTHMYVVESSSNEGWAPSQGYQIIYPLKAHPHRKVVALRDIKEEFVYAPRLHNVVKVNSTEFSDCGTSKQTTPGQGNDTMTLTYGDNYFICTIGNYCHNQGMKFSVWAYRRSKRNERLSI
ncbi:basic blue protein [Striga asiatica]|uniref:Basic blue protein n=1 Tax=Striga asiatica TaxID=4170 RepID=A0A5A7REL8_STRAF|nr:basic blue protein [Striga asiatica]